MNGSPKVLHLTTDLQIGGRERIVVELSNAMWDRGYGCAVCCLKHSGVLAADLRNGIEVFQLHRKDRVDLSVLRPLKHILQKNEIDVLHTHSPGTLLYGFLAARWAGARAIVNTEHGFSHSLSSRARVRERFLCRRVDRVIAVSDELKEGIRAAYGLPEGQIVTVRNGIAAVSAGEEKSVSRGKLGMSEDQFHIGIVARLVPVKNHRLLLRAMARVRERAPGVRLWIAGDGELRARLEKLSRDSGLDGNVVFMGERTDIPVLLNGLDGFVLCSTSEGLSITLLEAMSAGLPIVATRVGGNGEAIEDGKSGLLVESDREDELSRAILRLIQDTAYARKLGAGARERFLSRYSVSRMAREMDGLYRTVLHEKGFHFLPHPARSRQSLSV